MYYLLSIITLSLEKYLADEKTVDMHVYISPTVPIEFLGGGLTTAPWLETNGLLATSIKNGRNFIFLTSYKHILLFIKVQFI